MNNLNPSSFELNFQFSTEDSENLEDFINSDNADLVTAEGKIETPSLDNYSGNEDISLDETVTHDVATAGDFQNLDTLVQEELAENPLYITNLATHTSSHRISSKGKDVNINALISSCPPRTVLSQVLKLQE